MTRKRPDLRAWRARLALTQQQLADGLGVSRATVMRWEHSRAYPLWLEVFQRFDVHEAHHYLTTTYTEGNA